MSLKVWIPKLFSSIITANTYILVFALLTLFVALSLRGRVRDIRQKPSEPGKGKDSMSVDTTRLKKLYELFTALISCFPLLGMLGTVIALLSLDMTGAMESIKDNFFDALTSTAWGIIFSVIFKLVNAYYIAVPVEEAIEKADQTVMGVGK